MSMYDEAIIYRDYIRTRVIGHWLTLTPDICLRVKSIDLIPDHLETEGLIVNELFIVTKKLLDQTVNGK